MTTETIRYLTTKQLAAVYRVKQESIRTALWKKGHYFGWKPKKMPNRFLIWQKTTKGGE